MMRLRAALLAAAVFALAGCVPAWLGELRRHAAVEHGCPQEHVVFLGDDGNALSRTARVQVCGNERVYHHRSNGAAYVWFDETPSHADEPGLVRTVSPGVP